MKRTRLVALAACLLVARPARAFDAATTHAGLTERALMASSLRSRIGALFAWGTERPLGLYRTLGLAGGDAGRDRLRERLARLDPASNAVPHDGELTALGWLIAGSMVEEVPPGRARNHFLDPDSGGGLSARRVISAIESRLSQPGGGFDGTGVASTSWLVAPDNDLSLPRFLAARERSLAAALPAERDVAAAESLLIAGALLHVIEDAAEPAYVHNDFRVDLFDRRAPFTGFVAARYGRLAIPPPAGPAQPLVHLADAIHDREHRGLADRTAVRFYSLGLLEIANGGFARGATRPAGLPALVAGPGAEGYFEDGGGRRLARWSRSPAGIVRWSFDPRCYQDAAAVLVPEAAQAALSALEHLFRGGLTLAPGKVAVGEVALGAGRVLLLVEDEQGRRSEALAHDVAGAAAGASLVDLPPGIAGKQVVAVFRGVDIHGEPIVANSDVTTAR